MNYATMKIKELKQIAAQKGIKPAGDKRKKQTWIDALNATPKTITTRQPKADVVDLLTTAIVEAIVEGNGATGLKTATTLYLHNFDADVPGKVHKSAAYYDLIRREVERHLYAVA